MPQEYSPFVERLIQESGISPKPINDTNKTYDIKDFLDLKRPKKMTFGLEAEMFLCFKWGKRVKVVNGGTDDIEPDATPMSFIIENTKEPKYAERIYKDFYYNQLELRTPPFSNPALMLNDIKKSYNHVQEILYKGNTSVFKEHEIITVPSSVLSGMNTTCGIHLHIRPKYLYNTFVNSYPILIPFMENSQCSPMDTNILSYRQTEDRHISGHNMTFTQNNPTSKKMFMDSRNRNCDIIINKNKKSAFNDRHRVKTINTIEYRVFDTNWDFEHIRKTLLLFTHVLRHLKQDKILDYSNRMLRLTRNEAVYTKHGYNYIFDKPNTEILKELSEIFDIDINKFSTPIRKGFMHDAMNIRPYSILEQVNW